MCLATAEAATHIFPDGVVLNDGTQLQGLIIQNTSDLVVLETKNGEARIPKESIRRINDAPNEELIFSDLVGQGNLPSWRSVVHDLRTHDSIKSFQQIPPTTIENGLLRHIPYHSFRVNDYSELNIYGDIDDPVAIEFGIYGSHRVNNRTRRVFREFIAGHLHSQGQIAALYSLGPEKDEARSGDLAFRLIRPGDPDAYGGTWIVVYRPEAMEKARLSTSRYLALTQPFLKINRKDGRLRADLDGTNANWLSRTMKALTGQAPEVRGFYREEDGTLRILGYSAP